MAKRITRLTGEEAKHYLCDCGSEQCFWVNNGPIVKNLDELAVAMKGITDEQFTHHVNGERNDFSKWVAEVIGDRELAKALAKARTKTGAAKSTELRLRALKKTAS